MVTNQLQVRYRPGKVRRSEPDVLPLSYTANRYKTTTVIEQYRHVMVHLLPEDQVNGGDDADTNGYGRSRETGPILEILISRNDY